MTNHPITPPPELVQQWLQKATGPDYEQRIATQAARWGADTELEACCADLRMVLGPNQADWLHSVRRPKPPSLKEQALEALQSMQIDPVTINGVNVNADVIAKYDTIRRALKQLDD